MAEDRRERSHRKRGAAGEDGQAGYGGGIGERRDEEDPRSGRAAYPVEEPDPEGGQGGAAQGVGVRMLVRREIEPSVVTAHDRVAVRVSVGVSVPEAAVRVSMDVEGAMPPSEEQAGREADDQESDPDLCRPLKLGRQITVEQDDRQPERDQRRPVAEAPRQTQDPGPPGAPAGVVQDEGRDRGQVIGIGRVREPEEERDEKRRFAQGASSTDPADTRSVSSFT